jgi:hypothetical protein
MMCFFFVRQPVWYSYKYSIIHHVPTDTGVMNIMSCHEHPCSNLSTGTGVMNMNFLLPTVKGIISTMNYNLSIGTGVVITIFKDRHHVP